MAQSNDNRKAGKRSRIGVILYLLYVFFFICAIVLVGRIVWIQNSWTLDESIESVFRPADHNKAITPKRGSILDCNGRILATSIPMYQVTMDCAVQKEAYEIYDKEHIGKKPRKDSSWRAEARQLGDSLTLVFPEKTGQEWSDFILRKRDDGDHYEKIGHMIDHGTLQRIKKFPLLSSRRYRSGMNVETIDVREMPYGNLAKRLIGYMKVTDGDTTRIGIEGRYNKILHGEDGHMWMRIADSSNYIQNFSRPYTPPVDGKDIRLTIDIDIQDIAEKALRYELEGHTEIRQACAVVMEVKTGAIKAMVNLQKTKSGSFSEAYNIASLYHGEPGSVFKTVALTSLLEDGKIKNMREGAPVGSGNYQGTRYDPYIVSYGKKYNKSQCPAIDGLAISSNKVFWHLVTQHYKDSSRAYVANLGKYGFEEGISTDLGDLPKAIYSKPGQKGWDGLTLGSLAFGYAIQVTPLQTLTFYNAIANGGKMMKPYFIEDFEVDGKVETPGGQGILNNAICSRATADSVKLALRSVVASEIGTARDSLRKAPLSVAGKTGTARIALDTGGYSDRDGNFMHQGSFVGFFPYEDPEYSVIVVGWTTLGHKYCYGARIPAGTVRHIIDGIYGLQPRWGAKLDETAEAQPMPRPEGWNGTAGVQMDEPWKTMVPDVKGMGLKDAIYAAEASGLICTYTGFGHVSKQIPEAGTEMEKGDTLKITLK